jgi:HD-like signal output (HDOD) protein
VTRPSLQELVAATGELATLPATVIQLIDLLEDTTTCAERVQEVLERDPAMTANVLKLANSAYYGVRRSISNVREALVMLGNRSVMTLAFATGMAPVLRRDLACYDLGREAYWRHGVVAAAASSRAADLCGNGRWRTQAFTAGLVHDIGKLVIDTYLAAEGEDLVFDDEGRGLRESERIALGYDHGEVGGALAEAWGFPEVLVAAVAYHHDPTLAPEPGPVVRAVAVGDLVSRALTADLADPWDEETARGLLRLGCETRDFEQLRLDLAGDLDETLTAAATPATCLV